MLRHVPCVLKKILIRKSIYWFIFFSFLWNQSLLKANFLKDLHLKQTMSPGFKAILTRTLITMARHLTVLVFLLKLLLFFLVLCLPQLLFWVVIVAAVSFSSSFWVIIASNPIFPVTLVNFMCQMQRFSGIYVWCCGVLWGVWCCGMLCFTTECLYNHTYTFTFVCDIIHRI